MDRIDKIRKLKSLAPVLSAALVFTCAVSSLHGYEAPVYAYEAPVVEKETQTAEEKTEEKEISVGNFELEDGVYQGTGTGYAGDIVVSVQIKNKQLTLIEILSSSDDSAFLNRAKAVIDKIIEFQKLDVDTVSGATYSSNGIISAVKNALTGEKDQSEPVSSKGSGSTGTPVSVEKVEDAKAYQDGVYYGTGTGFGGTLKVKLEIIGGKIDSVYIVEHQDGDSYIQEASVLIEQIIASQSTNVDTVSGATYSSAGIIEAIRNALSQAAVNTVPDSSGSSDDIPQGDSEEESSVVTGTVPYNEGIYYGTAEGYNGDITVAVVIQDHTIKAILVMQQEDDEAFFNRAMDVVKQVMTVQNTDVDTVSGATYSSTGLLNAIKNALKEAERVTNGEETEESDTEKETEESDTEEETEESDTEEGTEESDTDEEEEENTKYIDGTYKGIATCQPDEDEDFEEYQLSLKVTITKDKIVSITEVEGDGDSSNDSYIKRAADGTSSKPGVVTQILEKGTTEGIDTVSRATCSSKAIIEACQKALESAVRRIQGENK